MKTNYYQFKNNTFECHFHIETNKFSQVSVRVGVFCSEDRTDLKDFRQITADAHLLVELRRLREVRLRVKVLDLEDRRTALRRAADELRGLDFAEVALVERLAEEPAHGRRELEDSVSSRGSHLDDAVVQAGRLVDGDVLLLFLLLGVELLELLLDGRLLKFLLRLALHQRVDFRLHQRNSLLLLFEHSLRTRSVLELQRERRGGNTHDEQLLDSDLDFGLGGGRDGLLRDGDDAGDVHDGLARDTRGERNHVLGDLLALRDDALHRVDRVADDQEAQVALATDVVHTTADGDRLVLQRGGELRDLGEGRGAHGDGGHHDGQDAEVLARELGGLRGAALLGELLGTRGLSGLLLLLGGELLQLAGCVGETV